MEAERWRATVEQGLTLPIPEGQRSVKVLLDLLSPAYRMPLALYRGAQRTSGSQEGYPPRRVRVWAPKTSYPITFLRAYSTDGQTES